ncbi:MAG: response regulator [Spirochaetales bacterium]|nr:response regulator [Spirochaetales bacterium]
MKSRLSYNNGLFFLMFSLISFFCFSYYSCGKSDDSGKGIIHAKKGILDIKDWDSEKKQIISLDGEWEFYWMKLYDPDDFTNKTVDEKPLYFNFPGIWNDYRLPNGDTLPKDGYATFRLIIEDSGVINEDYAIEISYMATSYKFYVNDRLFLANGNVGRDASTSIPQFMPKNKRLHINNKNEIQLVLQVSNFGYLWGGVNEIILAEKNMLENQCFLKLLINGILIGMILIIGIYHLCLFFLFKKEKANLIFGICCLLVGIRYLSTEHYISTIFSNLDVWEYVMKINFGTFVLGPLLLAFFLQRLYPEEFNLLVLKIMMAFGLLFILPVLFFPGSIYINLIDTPYKIIFVLYFLYFIFVICRAVYKKRLGALPFLIGFIFLFLCSVNDMLHSSKIIMTVDLLAFGFLTLVLSQSIVLSIKVSMAYNEVDQLNRNLEKKVKERTMELELSKKHIEKINEEKTNFFINVTHEIKTPLTLIRNYLERCINKFGKKSDLLIIKQNVQKIEHDMVNFFDLEKFNKGLEIYQHDKKVDFSNFLKSKILLFKETASNKNIKIRKNIENNIFIRIDPYALDRIINNLIDNAIRYTDENGVINIILNDDKESVELIIQDTGMGIPKNQLPYIFEPYFQANHKKMNSQGIGLGLSIVKKIIDQINAEILVKSKANEGSEFMINFKKCKKAGGAIYEAENICSKPILYKQLDVNNEKYQSEHANILIVEDNIDMSTYLQSNLMKEYNIYCAANGKMALQRLESIPKPDLIISDIMMDEMGGLDFFKELGKIESFKSIPFIFLTARNEIKEKIEYLKEGAIDFISKPFSMDELNAKIISILRMQKMQKDEHFKEMERKISHIIRSDIIEDKSDYKWIDNKCREYSITEKEKEIITLLMAGNEYKEIAYYLKISINTLKPYIRNIYKKLDISNKIELMNVFKR